MFERKGGNKELESERRKKEKLKIEQRLYSVEQESEPRIND